MTNDNKKKALTSLLVAIIVLFGLVISSAFAYFAADTSNSFGTKSITAEAESAGSVALNGTNATIMLNLSESDMRKDTNDITYWGTSTGDPSTTQNVVTIGSTSVSGGKTYNCSYSGSITASGTNNMYTVFQSMTGKSANQIVLKIGENTYDFNTANLFPISISGTLNGISSSNVANITAEFYLVNKSNVDQTDLAGTDISINVLINDFDCTVPMPPKSAADTIIELAQNDNTIVKYTGKVTDRYQDYGEGVDATKVFLYTSNSSNNVVFSEHCWQIIRTTETGGVKLLYNGEPIVGSSGGETTYDCGNSRPFKTGTLSETKTLSGTVLFGKGFTTSFSGGVLYFDLTDTKSFEITAENASTLISEIAENYPYTCGSSSSGHCNDDTYHTLYKVDSYINNTNFNVYTISYYDSIYKGQFNPLSGGPIIKLVGYMYPTASPNNIVDDLYGDNVNQNDSRIKNGVENWFSNSNIDTSKLENAVFCNDRSSNTDYSTINIYNPAYYFKGNYSATLDFLNCTNLTDSFSYDNVKAKTTYSVGLISSSEVALTGINNGAVSEFWTISPSYARYDYNPSAITYAKTDGTLFHATNLRKNVRPVVSLNSSATIASGTGSTSDPFVIAGSEMTP